MDDGADLIAKIKAAGRSATASIAAEEVEVLYRGVPCKVVISSVLDHYNTLVESHIRFVARVCMRKSSNVRIARAAFFPAETNPLGQLIQAELQKKQIFMRPFDRLFMIQTVKFMSCIGDGADSGGRSR